MGEIKLREFLKEGDIIRTRHNQYPNWVTNIILGIDDNCIEIDIGLEKNYISNVVIIGDTMKCKFISDDKEFTLLGWVTRIKPDFPQKLTVRVHNVEWFSNKRDSYRHDVYLCAVIKESKEDNEKGVFAILTNLSMKGGAFTTHEDLNVAVKTINDEEFIPSKLYFEIFIAPGKQLCFLGQVVRKCSNEKGIEYGVQICDIDYEDERLLSELVIELENIDKEVYNKRSSFWSKNSKYGV